MTRPRISRNRIKKAIANSGGVVAVVCRRTGYSWRAVRDFIRADEELSRMMQDEAETINDIAEQTIIDRIKRGDENNARWWLARTRRAKFGDSVDVTSAGEKVSFIVKWGDFADDDASD